MSTHNKSAILFTALLLYPIITFSQVNSWSVYSSFSTVNDIVVSSSERYIATSGGIFIVRDQIIEERLTTVNGLHRLDPRSIYLDHSVNDIVVGYTDGVINILNIESSEIQSLTDINRIDGFNSKQIHHITGYNDNIYVGTDFGIVVYANQDYLVSNTFVKIGAFERGIPIYDIEILNDTIFVATSTGLGFASLNDNLIISDNWENHVINNEGNNRIDSIEKLNGKLYAISDNRLYSFISNTWSEVSISGISQPVDLSSDQTKLVVADINSVSIIENGITQTIFSTSESSIKNVELADDKLFIGTASEGVIEIDLNSDQEIRYVPDGPYLNFFSQLDFQGNTLLATATAEFPQSDPFNNIRGYYIYKDQRWENFNRNTNSELNNFGFSTAYSALNNDDYYVIGSWGEGIVIHEKETNAIQVFDSRNSDFSGIAANRNYLVISGIDDDSANNIWAISFISDFPLNVYSSDDDTWTHFSSAPINSNELYYRLFIDSNNHLWISLIDIENNGQGLLIIDPGSDRLSNSDDTFRKLTSSENNGNLPDDNVSAIVEDKEGEIWIGTERGIARFIFPRFIVSSTNPSEYRAQWLINSDTSAASRFLLRDVSVSSIAVNSANQKWIGSKSQGVWLVNADGSAIVKRLTKDNSPLLSDNILDISIDEKSGEVFFSTDLGLTSFTDVSKSPVETMSELKVYPNPFVYEKHSEIIIENLADQTRVKIVGADGAVFNDFETRGGRIKWDAKAANGTMLSSGVYFIIALDENDKEKGIGKVVIIK